MKRLAATLFVFLGSHALAGETTPNLPPANLVASVLRASPEVQAAASQIAAETANRRRLEAGPHEWNIRMGAQQRRSHPVAGGNERFSEWNTAIERPLRLPGKAALDSELGTAGVALAEAALGDALHEASRSLLKAWFVWLKDRTAAAQWAEQVALLERQAKAVQRRQQLGDAARLETVQAEAALAQAQTQLAQARVRERTGAEDLRRRFPGLPQGEAGSTVEPSPITGNEQEWVDAILEHSHELGLARRETRRAQIVAGRSGSDRLPDPTIGVHVSSERGGEDHIVGAYLSIPLAGGARRASADAALALAEAASRREAAATRKIGAEAAALYQSANAALAICQASLNAAEGLERVATMSARAYQLGEGSFSDLLTARRLANEARLSARLLQLEAHELRYRLLLDAHRLWALDDGDFH